MPYNRLQVKLPHLMDDDLTGTMLQCQGVPMSGAQRIKPITRYVFGQPACKHRHVMCAKQSEETLPETNLCLSR